MRSSPMLMRYARLIAAAPAFALLTAACGATEPNPGVVMDFARARARWSATAPASYQLTVAHGCFCVLEGPVIVTVRNGAVESRRFADTGIDVPTALADAYPSVDELFGIIADAIAKHPAYIDVRYDVFHGFPVAVSIDPLANVADEESYYSAADFKRL